MARRLKQEDGFTLVELLVTMLILGFVFTTFSLVVSSTVTHSAVITKESVLQTQLRSAVNQMTKDLREASVPSLAATSPFVTAAGTMSTTSITFYAPDSTYTAVAPTTYHLREICYQLSAGNFQRASAISSNTGGPAWTIPALGAFETQLGGVLNTAVFTYYDGSNPPVLTTSAAAVRTVVVTLTVEAPGTPGQYTYSGSATLRETPPS
ncbi:MAG TPA: prepilin-type N-terminal cleavage/methylation domain-containing protein [Gaiellaceae bacterium]